MSPSALVSRTRPGLPGSGLYASGLMSNGSEEESGTGAAEMPGQVPDHIKQQRLEELMLTQQKIAFAKNKKRIGSKLTCLVDSIDSKGVGCGRFYGQAPDIDSVCIIKNCSAGPGQFVDTKVIAAKDYDLVVEQI